MKTIILSSSSAPRKKLLKQLRIDFKIFHPNVDEKILANETPTKLVKRLAKLKACAVKTKYPDALSIGADQVAMIEGQILGKPRDYEEALMMLKLISGKKLVYYSGICLYNTKTQHTQVAIEKFSVIFRKFDEALMKNYLRKEHPYDCAGCVKLEGPGISLIDAIYSRDPSALLGLPLIKLVRMLENENIQIL